MLGEKKLLKMVDEELASDKWQKLIPAYNKEQNQNVKRAEDKIEFQIFKVRRLAYFHM